MYNFNSSKHTQLIIWRASEMDISSSKLGSAKNHQLNGFPFQLCKFMNYNMVMRKLTSYRHRALSNQANIFNLWGI